MTVSSLASAAGIRTIQDMNYVETPSAEASEDLSSENFLTLMTAQLQNQDPLSPMENAEFLSQLSQMSTVQGISDMNSTMSALAAQLSGSAISEASSMLGQRALVTGSTVRSEGAIEGRITLAEDADRVTLTYTDAETGQVLHNTVLNDQPTGNLDFSWDEAPTDGRRVRVSAVVEDGSGTISASTSVYAQIDGVEVDPRTSALTVHVQDYGYFLGGEITALR